MNTKEEIKEEEITEIPSDQEIADQSCNHCHGTGVSGYYVDGQDDPPNTENRHFAERIPVTCLCVRKAKVQKVAWLQRHGVDKQPWVIRDA